MATILACCHIMRRLQSPKAMTLNQQVQGSIPCWPTTNEQAAPVTVQPFFFSGRDFLCNSLPVRLWVTSLACADLRLEALRIVSACGPSSSRLGDYSVHPVRPAFDCSSRQSSIFLQPQDHLWIFPLFPSTGVCTPASVTAAMFPPPPSRFRPSPRCSKAATSSVWPRPAPARRPHSRCLCCSA